MATPINSSSRRTKASRTLLNVVLCGMFTAVLFVSKETIAWLVPHVEVVTLLIAVYATVFGWWTAPSIMVFAVLQGVWYGFSIWWVMYLYIWYVPMLFGILLRRIRNPIPMAFLCGLFGLAFGALCALPYLFVEGWSFALAWWLNGLVFDIPHAISNFCVVLVLFYPLRLAMEQIKRQLRL